MTAAPVYLSCWFANSSFIDLSLETLDALISAMRFDAEAIKQDIRELEELRDRGWTWAGSEYIDGFAIEITTTNREAAEEYELGADKISDIFGDDDEAELSPDEEEQKEQE